MIEFRKYFNIGDKIQVIPLSRYKKIEYTSQIADIYEDYIDIFNPIYKNSLIYFRNDEKLRIIMPKTEAIYEFDAKVIENRFGKIPIIRLKIVSELKKIQRRNYYRLKITKPIRFRKVDKNESIDKTSQYYEGIVLDISGGGLLFCAKHDMDKGELLEFELYIDNNKKLDLYGIIVRKQYDIQKSFLYEYGVKFQNISAANKDELVKFIFNEQRKLLKKGLI